MQQQEPTADAIALQALQAELEEATERSKQESTRLYKAALEKNPNLNVMIDDCLRYCRKVSEIEQKIAELTPNRRLIKLKSLVDANWPGMQVHKHPPNRIRQPTT